MGRAPCCDKANVKKGPWSPEEDAKLKTYIDQNGTGGNWIALPQKIGLKRCGKSCRLRWLNYLRPNIKHGGFSEEEDNIICGLYITIGSRWSIIAAQLPGRTDNDIKNYWNTRLKKKLLGKQRKEQQAARRSAKQDMTVIKREITDNINDQYHHHHHHQLYNINSSPFSQYFPPSQAATYDLIAEPFGPSDQMAVAVDQQASIKSHLAKLGGKFSETSRDDIQALHQPSSTFDSTNNNNYYYYLGTSTDQNTFQLGLENLQAELSELINYRSYQRDEELVLDSTNTNPSSFSEMEHLVTASTTTSSSSSSHSFVNYAPNMVSLQLPPQDYSGFDDNPESLSSNCFFVTN